MTDAQIEAAFDHMDHNWSEVIESQVVGCTFCRAQFGPTDVSHVYGWDEGAAFDRPLQEAIPNDTVCCPKCDLPYVIGDASGLPVSDKNYLNAVFERWHNSNA